MRVWIAGVDGYLGWALAQRLASRGHEVAGADNYFRRAWVEEMGAWSAIPVAPMSERLEAFRERFGKSMPFWEGDLRDYGFVERIVREFRPEAIVHLAECPSAPYSAIDVDHAVFVQTNNLTTTFHLLFAMKAHAPDAHLIKLGTMGEYGTPNLDIPEGFFEVEFRGRKDRLPFPRQAGSWYHWSKVHGSNNVMFACKLWGLAATDIMQGIVFGAYPDALNEDGRLSTRLDFDQAFGTIVNRFCCQAVAGHPLTLYGSGRQQRGFIPLPDSMQCLTLAVENPPEPGQYRVLNQFQNVYRLADWAHKVASVADEFGLKPDIRHVDNPRMEMEDHHYRPEHDALFRLGYEPTRDIDPVLRSMIAALLPHADRIRRKREALLPDIRWDGRRSRAEYR
ncbi:NAD-dependent epimerase/dehydratase family protein [Paenibacillus flagellatus]|uniref:NAD-dependent dehydratase n=1 Tax=Paenibacillus flagellatus TaxID=2211139 RepID=A0A2V5K866_9BACL|nr:NAD-dependent epimerase/dehydratase family protein [Paenibacillus flagellatus]PYI55661.1 NAD-dependent dehydratase [Paenibacillus flagellatus]